VLKTSPANVTVYPQMIGGGFGRRAQPDFVVDAVLLSKIVGGGTPVKVIYSREDDVAAGRMHPMTVHKIDVGFDKKDPALPGRRRYGEGTDLWAAPDRRPRTRLLSLPDGTRRGVFSPAYRREDRHEIQSGPG